MSSRPVESSHPVLDFAHRLRGRVDSLAGVPVLSLSAADTREALSELAQGEAQLSALRLRLLAQAEASGATAEAGAGSAADWLAVESRQVRREARSDLALASRLSDHPHLEGAMAAGSVNPAQARAIVGAVDRLPASGVFAVSAEQRAAAEEHLVALAADHDAVALRRLGDRVLEVIAPELAEEFEGRALEREEARALRQTSLSLWEDSQGVCHGRFKIPARHGQMLRKMILAIASPSRHLDGSASAAAAPADEVGVGSGIDPDLPVATRHGIAFTQLLESVTASDLPAAGGCGATVVVTMSLEQLLAPLEAAGVCTLDTGGRISAAEARRLACRAGIIPMVLGGRGQVLDVGRRRRLHTEGQRIAMGVRDRGCTARDCETPPGLCHAHHDAPWSRGGGTSVENGRLLCPHHHRTVHDPAYATTQHLDGTVSFHRRT